KSTRPDFNIDTPIRGNRFRHMRLSLALLTSIAIASAGCSTGTQTPAPPPDSGAEGQNTAGTVHAPCHDATGGGEAVRGAATAPDGTANGDAAVTGLTCSAAMAIENVAEPASRPVLLSNGTKIALAFQRGPQALHDYAVQMGDGITFGA